MAAHFESLLKNKNRAYLPPGSHPIGPPQTRKVAFVLLEHFSMMAFTGAVDALVTANLMRPSTPYEVIVASISGKHVLSDLHIETPVSCQLEELDERQLDMLIICGGLRVQLQQAQGIRNKLKAASKVGVTLGGLWNGAWFLADAGLLHGYECAYHPDGRTALREMFPEVTISKHHHVLDRERLTCAGANSSLDMMLQVVRRDCGEEFTNAIEEILSCDKRQEIADISVISIDHDPTLPQPLKIALELMQNNIEEPLSIHEIADCIDISRRQLERLFQRHVDACPSRYYLELRLTHARRLLQQTNKSITDIAVATGFISISHFRRSFHQLFDIPPGRFRKTQASQEHNLQG